MKKGINWGYANKSVWEWLLFLATLLEALGAIAIPLEVTIIGLNFTQQQAQTGLQLAQDQQQETTLQTYLNDMSDLLLTHTPDLRASKAGDAMRQVARERTLTTLRRLNADRNKIVLQFLQGAQLIGIKNPIIDLSNADLSNDDLSGADLSNINLNGTTLNNAHLNNATLNGADLSNATLNGADLNGAHDLTQQQLNEVHSCNNAKLSTGLTCYRNP